MAKENPRRIAEEKAATIDEITEAIECLSRLDLHRLKKSAQFRIGGLGRAALGRDWEVLLHETVLSFYKSEGRRWKKTEVDFVRTMTEAMRSVAYNWKRAFDENEALLESEVGTLEEGRGLFSLSEAPGGHWNTQSDLENTEKLEKIEQLLSERNVAALIFDGMREEMTGPEIQTALEISENEYETQMTWIRRKIRKAFKGGSNG